jgi:hypothetical protein
MAVTGLHARWVYLLSQAAIRASAMAAEAMAYNLAASTTLRFEAT